MQSFLSFFLVLAPYLAEAINPIFPEHSLAEKYVEYQKVVIKRLSSFDPINVKMSYDESSPRKFIKNVLVYYNGYYEVEFYSQKLKKEMRCDVNMGHTTNGSASQGNPDPFIMNCEFKDGSSNFIETAIRQQHPLLANPDPIYLSSHFLADTLTNVSLIDIFMFSIEYTDLISKKRKRCFVVLDYQQMPMMYIDQKILLNDCHDVDEGHQYSNKSDIPHFFDSDCFQVDQINKPNTEANLELINGLYDFYADSLDKKWKLPEESEIRCEENNMEYWTELAQKQIEFSHLKLKTEPINSDETLLALEKAVIENALINQAYNRLYLKNRKDDSSPNYLKWLSVASHSSPTVGKVLRYSYADKLPQKYVEGNVGLNEIISNDREHIKQLDSTLARTFASRSDVALMSAKGNKKVFLDMYWQNLAASYCGPQKARSLNYELWKKYRNGPDKDEAKANHHKELMDAWSLIETGVDSNPAGQEFIDAGNLALLNIEQKNILQPLMYETTEARIVGSLGIFNSLAKSEIPLASGEPILNFEEYTDSKGLSSDLSNLKTRLNWMEYVVSEQSLYLDSMSKQGGNKAVFMRPLYDSYLLLSDYDLETPAE